MSKEDFKTGGYCAICLNESANCNCMEEFFKTPTQEEVDKQWLQQLCWDGQMEDSEIEEFIDAMILWKDKGVKVELSKTKSKMIEKVNSISDENFDKRDARIIITTTN